MDGVDWVCNSLGSSPSLFPGFENNAIATGRIRAVGGVVFSADLRVRFSVFPRGTAFEFTFNLCL